MADILQLLYINMDNNQRPLEVLQRLPICHQFNKIKNEINQIYSVLDVWFIFIIIFLIRRNYLNIIYI